MTIKLYHQVGHNPNWNRESFVDDSCGDGLILSPVHQDRAQIEKLSVKLRRASIFDPQYYLPNSQKSKLHSYVFFPEALSGGFSTKTYAALALESARQCLAFQLESQFERVIIPARYFSQMDPDYTEKQDAYTVEPFLKAARELNVKNPMFLSVPLTSHMLESKKYRTGLLNWVTSFPKIRGVYVFASNDRDTKQPQDQKFLNSYLDFLYELREADMELQVGYLNTEALLFSLLGDISLSMGTFENTRMFSIDKFIVSNEERRGPRARIYLPGLLNWVQVDQAKQIKTKLPKLWKKIYSATKYGDQALASLVEPTFNQPHLYKHHFLCFQSQVDELKLVDGIERHGVLSSWIKAAAQFYEEIADASIEIERHGSGEHLSSWEKAIDDFADSHL